MLDDHPLSIELVAPHLKTLTPRQIRDEFGQLLERFADEGAYEGRNRSLLASLEFSKRRLSQAAQQMLPYLAWFEGGVFEQFLLDFTELAPEAWAPSAAELVATALLKVEELRSSTRPTCASTRPCPTPPAPATCPTQRPPRSASSPSTWR